MISGTIEEIHPDAQYQGTVYTQTVVVKLGCETIELFDGTTTAATEDHIGKPVELRVTAQPIVLKPASCTSVGITERGDTYKLVGTIEAVSHPPGDSQSLFILNIGAGTIDVEMDSTMVEEAENGEIKPGMEVTVMASRLDLKDVETK